MVLSLMRRHAKSYLIKFLIGMIAIVFIFYFGYSFRARNVVKIAVVNGEVISAREYEKAYRDLVEGLRRQYGDMWTDSLVKKLRLRQRALEGLIERKLISHEAKRFGLSVTKEEIQKAIMEYPAFQINGRFNLGRYQSLLRQNRMKPEDFEQSMAMELLQKKIRGLLWSFIPVTEQEIKDRYKFSNEKVKIGYVKFSPSRFKKGIQVNEQELKAYFEKHKEEFRVPEKIRVRYIVINPDEFKDKVKITDEEIREYYEDNLASFRVKRQIKARHILFRLPPDATKEQEKKVRKKAEEVLKEARAGKDFAELAKKYSEGPTKSKGGDLGYFSKGMMVKPFEDAAFKLKKGEISDLVRTRFGYHIIKVEDMRDARTKPLNEVKGQIRDLLVRTKCKDLAYDKGLSLIDQMPYEVDLSKYAKEHSLTVNSTDFFSKTEPIPGLGGDPKLREALFALEKEETTDLIELNGKYYIFQVAERKPSYLPKLEDVKDKVKSRFIEDKAAQAAKEAAERFLKEVRSGKAWDKLAKKQGVKTEHTDYFTRTGVVPKIGYAPGLQEMVFSLSERNPYPKKVFQNRSGSFVVRWEGKKDIDEKEYEKEKEKYRAALLYAKQNRLFEQWLQALKAKAQIEVITPVEKG
ncbi:MAG: hypothetical protein DRH12_09230 [Deltaproteobacteria bacterium]|nr:MAG: hypothetical protein DRH12_09230 [Deltaproteobacteria bacterium]